MAFVLQICAKDANYKFFDILNLRSCWWMIMGLMQRDEGRIGKFRTNCKNVEGKRKVPMPIGFPPKSIWRN
jgi:hypothetical protein